MLTRPTSRHFARAIPSRYNTFMSYYNYNEFTQDVQTLARQVAPYKPTVLLGIVRGGLALTQALSHALNIRNVQTIRTELYDADVKRDEIKIVANLDFLPSDRVLIVDDIVDSGESLQAILEYLKSYHKDVEVRSASIFYKTSALVQADYQLKEATDWIEFYWEKDFKVERL